MRLRNQKPLVNGSTIIIDSETIIIDSDESEDESTKSASISDEKSEDACSIVNGKGSPLLFGNASAPLDDSIASIASLGISKNSFAKDDSFSCDQQSDHITRLKTFKTYGKVKWRRRELTCDWDSVKNINSVVKPTSTIASANKWSTKKDEMENGDDSDVRRNSNGKSKHCLFNDFDVVVTPVRKNCSNEIHALHSTPKTSTPGVAPFTRTPVCISENTEDKLGFHRSISFVNSLLLNTSNKQSSVNNARSHALSSISVLHHNKSCSSVNDDKSQNSLFITPEGQVLTLCGQESIINIKDYINDLECPFLRKIGEGSYGEVYERKNCDGRSIILKIVPVGSEDVLVNGIQQMTVEEILTEMSICKTLSDLKQINNDSSKCSTLGFIRLHRLIFCHGRYPHELVKLWEHFDSEKKSLNDNPKTLQRCQKYILFETDYCGIDLENFNIKTEDEAFSILKQVVASLAVSERLYQFEHRDLHWGNILIMPTDKKTIDFVLSGAEYKIDSRGLQVTIIDFTLSRIQSEDCVVFTDLSKEEDLFNGKGDIQFNVYRDMKDHNDNDWESFNPYTNILWIHYLAQKLIGKLSCTRSPLNLFMRQVLTYSSAYEILAGGEFIS